MDEELLKKCNFCDMELPKDYISRSGNIFIGADSLRKYLPKITTGWVPELSLSCEECLEYIKNFHAIYSKWKFNEQTIQTKGAGLLEKSPAHIDRLKKNSSSTCRLCLKSTNAQESYSINVDFNQQYRKGYIQKMIALHAPFIDLKLIKDPIMCLTCFNAIQTFDAFYQMCDQTFLFKKKMKVTYDKEAVPKDVEEKTVETVENVTEVRQQSNSEKPQEDAICIISDDDEVLVVSQQGLKRKPMKFIKKPHVKKIRLNKTPSTKVTNSPTPEEMMGKIPKMTSESNEDQYTVVEIDDSDSQDSDDASNIIIQRTLEPKKLILEDEMEKTNIPELNEQVTDSDVLIEINMTNVQKLFQPEEPQLECVVYSNKPSTEDATPTDDSVEIPDSTTVDKQELESDLSDFLQFKNTTPTVEETILGREATITPCFEINMTSLKKMLDSNQVDKDNNENDVDVGKDSTNHQNLNGPQSYMSSFEDFLKRGVTHRGQISDFQEKNVDTSQKNTNGNTAGNYYVCFPYQTNDSLFEGRIRKIDALIFEDAQKLRSYKCNLCLATFTQESQLREHQCWDYCRSKMAKQFECREVSCNYRTTKKFDMREHAASHQVTKDFVYKCKFCEFRATHAYATRQHQAQTHHKGVVHNVPKCPHCFFECSDVVIMEHHILRRHPMPKRHVIL